MSNFSIVSYIYFGNHISRQRFVAMREGREDGGGLEPSTMLGGACEEFSSHVGLDWPIGLKGVT